MASAVFPIPPMPCTACTTVDRPARRALRRLTRSWSRPVKARFRAGTFHTRPTGISSERARGSLTNAWKSTSLSFSGVLTFAVISPLSASRVRKACCRSP